MLTIGQQVSKVDVNGRIGSQKVYEIATVVAVADLDAFAQKYFDGEEVVYTVRKVGGKGKGGCWYSGKNLVAAS